MDVACGTALHVACGTGFFLGIEHVCSEEESVGQEWHRRLAGREATRRRARLGYAAVRGPVGRLVARQQQRGTVRWLPGRGELDARRPGTTGWARRSRGCNCYRAPSGSVARTRSGAVRTRSGRRRLPRLDVGCSLDSVGSAVWVQQRAAGAHGDDADTRPGRGRARTGRGSTAVSPTTRASMGRCGQEQGKGCAGYGWKGMRTTGKQEKRTGEAHQGEVRRRWSGLRWFCCLCAGTSRRWRGGGMSSARAQLRVKALAHLLLRRGEEEERRG